jgi:hypothetical protein
MITATVSLTVPPLTDNAVAFANATAWNNYWNNISANITIDAIETDVYTSTPYNSALQPASITIDDVEFVLVTKTMFDSLKGELQTLNSSYQVMRTQLRDAGLIDFV